MQGFLKSLGVALVLSLVTPAFLCAAANQKDAKDFARAERALGQKARAERQARLAEKGAILKQMQGSNDPALRKQLIQQQMKGGN